MNNKQAFFGTNGNVGVFHFIVGGLISICILKYGLHWQLQWWAYPICFVAWPVVFVIGFCTLLIHLMNLVF